MIRTVQHGGPIAEKNAAKTQFRRNTFRSQTRQPTICHEVTNWRIAAVNPAKTQLRPESELESEPVA